VGKAISGIQVKTKVKLTLLYMLEKHDNHKLYQFYVIKGLRQTWLAASSLPGLYWSLICFVVSQS